MMESVKQRECLTLQEIANFVVEKKAKERKQWVYFHCPSIGTYEHDYGIEVSGECGCGYRFEQSECHYDLALWKILDRIALLEDEQ